MRKPHSLQRGSRSIGLLTAILSLLIAPLSSGDLPFGENMRARGGKLWNVVETEDGTLSHSDYADTHVYKPNLIAPVDKMQVSRFALTFYWQQVLEPTKREEDGYIVADRKFAKRTKFILQVAKDPEFTQVILQSGNMSPLARGGAFYRISKRRQWNFKEGETYYWRARIVRQDPEEESKYTEEELWGKRGSPIFSFTVEKEQDTYSDLEPPRSIDDTHPAFFIAQPREIPVEENIPESLRPHLLYSGVIRQDIHSKKVDDAFELYLDGNGPGFVEYLLYDPPYNQNLPEEHSYISLGGGDDKITLLEYILQKERELGLNKILAINASEIAWKIGSSKGAQATREKIESMILLAAKYGKYFIWSESTDGYLLWQHVGLSPELTEVMQRHQKYLIVGHKNMTNQRGFVSMEQTLGLRLGGFADQNLLHIEPWYWSKGWTTSPSVVTLENFATVKEVLQGARAYPSSFYAQQILVSLTQGVSTYFISGQTTLQDNPKHLNPSEMWYVYKDKESVKDWTTCQPLPPTANHLFPLLGFITEHDLIPTKAELLEQTAFVVGVRSDKVRTNPSFQSYGDPRIPDQVFKNGTTLQDPRPWELYYPLADLLYGFDKTDWFTGPDYTEPYGFYEDYQFALANIKDHPSQEERQRLRKVCLFFSEMPCIPKHSSYGWVPHLPQRLLSGSQFPTSWSSEEGAKALPVLYIEDLSPSTPNASFAEYMQRAAEEIGRVSGNTPALPESEKTDTGEVFVRKWGDDAKFVVMNSHENKQKFPVVEGGVITEVRNTDQPFSLSINRTGDCHRIRGMRGALKARQYIVGKHKIDTSDLSEQLFLFVDSHYAKESEYRQTEFAVQCLAEPTVTVVGPENIPRNRIIRKSVWSPQEQELKLILNHDYAIKNRKKPNYFIILKVEVPYLPCEIPAVVEKRY